MTRLFVATPLHDARMHEAYAAGLLTAWASGLAGQWSRCNGTSLARQRDTLVANFLGSDCSHLLWVDSDIGWRADDARRLLDTGRDVVSGCYAKKIPAAPVVAKLLPNRDGELYEIEHAGAGFLLVTRRAIETLTRAFAADQYRDETGRALVSLFGQQLNEATEDVAFFRRWRSLGGQAWLHTGCVVTHYDGNTPYRPDLSELRAHLPEQQAAAE